MRRLWIGLLVMLATPGLAAEPAFDARAAWAEFGTLLRERYGYFHRPGVDGKAIVAAFAAQAEAALDRKAFIDVAQTVALNFADPHFVVGPRDDGDWAVVPTSADLVAAPGDGGWRIADVRRGSDAAAKGLAPGMMIERIDGRAPDAAMAAVTGRPARALSDVQQRHAMTVALAGKRQAGRRIEVRDAGRARAVDLAATDVLADAVDAMPPLSAVRRGDVLVVRFNNSLGRNETIAAFRAVMATAASARAMVLDFRGTPSGGNSTVARAIMGHFTDRERPYQVHMVPYEARVFGSPRKFVELVLPQAPHFAGPVAVLGGRWTGSMGEGLMIGFDALGALTAGSELGDLLGALFNETLGVSGARIDLGLETLFHVDGRRREDFVPALHIVAAEGSDADDPLLDAVMLRLAGARR